MQVSVVIPTYNRPERVQRALHSLSQQTLPGDTYEVIVVDDGSDYDPSSIQEQTYPFSLRYIRQPNQGATVARNNGAEEAQGEVLVFMDDDVTASETALAALANACLQHTRILAMGTITARNPQGDVPYSQNAVNEANAWLGVELATDEFVHFSWTNTQLIAVRQEDFFILGMLQDPTGGWPNWDDVDFGYRAYLAGYRLLRCAQASAIHWDNSLASLKAACQRWQRASKSAVRLFAVHPGLQPHIPMYYDKTPIAWGKDNVKLVLRKLIRRLMSSAPILWLLEQTVKLLERIYPARPLLRPFYRWIEGGYMFRGYQEGLREHQVEGAS